MNTANKVQKLPARKTDTVGIDRLFDDLIDSFGSRNLFWTGPTFRNLRNFSDDVKFPKYNTLVNKETGELILEVALAGYSKDDLKLEVIEGGILELTGSIAETESDSGFEYSHKSMATRDFNISWNIGTHEVKDVKFTDGLLKVSLSPPKTKTKMLEIK